MVFDVEKVLKTGIVIFQPQKVYVKCVRFSLFLVEAFTKIF